MRRNTSELNNPPPTTQHTVVQAAGNRCSFLSAPTPDYLCSPRSVGCPPLPLPLCLCILGCHFVVHTEMVQNKMDCTNIFYMLPFYNIFDTNYYRMHSNHQSEDDILGYVWKLFIIPNVIRMQKLFPSVSRVQITVGTPGRGLVILFWLEARRSTF